MISRASRRIAVAMVTILLVGLPAGAVLAGAGDPTGTISATVPNQAGAPLTVQLTGQWVWPEFTTPCGPGTGPNRAAGWAIDWGDGFTGNRSLRKGSNPASYVHLGSGTDNNVYHSTANSGLGDCGTPSASGATGTWGPITHTYAQAGTYTACVSIYDIHYKNEARTKLSAAITTQTSFAVDKGSTISVGDVLLIDAEQMLVAGTTSNVITVVRGVNGTAIASHKKGVTVYAIVLSDAKQLIAGSNAPKYTAGDHNSDNSVEKNSVASGVPQCLAVTFQLASHPGIQVVKQASATQVHVGDTLTYTFTVTNTGDTDLAVVVSDPKCDPGTLNGPTGDTVADGKLGLTETWTYTCTHVVTAGDGDPLINVVTATGTDPLGTSVTDTANATVDILAQADLSVVKDDGLVAAVPGTGQTYQIAVSNNGPDPVSSLTLVEAVPAVLSSAAFTPSAGSYDPSTGVWSGLSLASGQTVTLTLNAFIDPGATGTLTNTVAVSTPAGMTDPNPANDTATDVDALTPLADLQITKTDGVVELVAGAPNAYTIVVSNAGPSDVTGATVADTFPVAISAPGWTATGAGGASGFSASGNGDIADTVNLPAGASITYSIPASVGLDARGVLVNTATVAAPAGVTDTDPTNNSATDTDTITTPTDLSITKDDGATSVADGGSVTYSIVVSNPSIFPSTSVTVDDAVPAELTGVSWTATGTIGSLFNASGTGSIHENVIVPPGGTITYLLTGTVTLGGAGSVTNTATVASPDDPNPANNSATDTDTVTAVVHADLSIAKTDGVATVQAGTGTTYTITVANAGPDPATGAAVSDLLPSDITGTWSATGTGGASGFTPSGSGNILDTVNLPSGATITYTLTATISGSAGSSVTNTATVAAPAGVVDANPANDSASDTDAVTHPADLSITKVDNAGGSSITSSTGTAGRGAALTYTIVVANNGPFDANAVTVADTLPAGLSGATWTAVATGGATFVASGSGNINESVAMPSGSTITYTVTATVASTASSITNTATVAATDGTPDPAPANNSASDTDNLTPTATDDSFTGAIGNTKFAVGVTVTGEPVVSVSGDVLTNDTGVGPKTAALATANVPGGRIVTMNGDGTFTYVPAPGFTGTDSFDYTVTDSLGTDTGTVQIDVSSMVWYVDNAAAAGDGRSVSPFNSLAPLNGGADPDGSGDIIFVYHGSGSYAGGLTLETNQQLIGEPFGLVVNANTLVAAGGTNPVITNAAGAAITLSSGNVIQRVNATGASGAGVTGSAITTLTYGSNTSISGNGGGGLVLSGAATGNIDVGAAITTAAGHSVSIAGRSGGTVTLSGAVSDTGTGISLASNAGATIILSGGVTATTGTNAAFSATSSGTISVTGSANTLSTTTGVALNVTNTTIGAAGLTFKSISSNGATSGIVLNNTGSSGGLTVTGTGSAASGGNILSSTDSGIVATSTKNLSLSFMNVANNGNAVNEGGIRMTDVTGTGAITSSTVSGSAEDNIYLRNDTATALTSFTIGGAGCSVTNNSTSIGNDGLTVLAATAANMAVTVDGCAWSGNRTIAIKADAGDNATLNVTIKNNVITQGSPNHGNQGIEVSDAGNGTVTFDVENNKVGTPDGTTASPLMNTGINIFNGSAGNAVLVGKVINNVVLNDASVPAFSSNGFGIRVFNSNLAATRARVTGNTVKNVSADYGILGESSGTGSAPSGTHGRLDLEVANNNVDVRSDALDAVRVQARNFNTGCAKITGNTTDTGGTGFVGIYVRQANSAVFDLDGWNGVGLPETYVAGQNPAAGSTGSAGTITGVAAGTCNFTGIP